MRARVLLPLTACVLAAHAWLLGQLPDWSSNSAQVMAEAQAPAFMTRSLALPPLPAPPAPPAPPARPAPAPAPAPAPPAKPRPPPVPRAAPAPAASAPAALAAPLPEDPPPAADAAAAAPASSEEERPAEVAASEVAVAEPEAPAPAEAQAPPAPETLLGMQLAAPGGPPQPVSEALPVALPAPARLTFEVTGQAKRFDYRASAELLWQHDGHSYQARQQIKAFLVGTRAQGSTGRITAAGLVPQRFVDQSRREKSAELDFSAGQARFTPAAAPAPIGDGAQDRLSVFFQLSALLAAAPEHYPTGSEITFTTVGSNDAERWTFRVQALENLELPLGTLAALHLERLPRHAGDQQAALWLAPTLGYLPARIRLTQANGDFADLRLQAHETP